MKKVLIYGLKNSGNSSILALNNKYKLYIYDDNKEVLENTYQQYSSYVEKLNEINIETIKELFFVVISPSISTYKEEIILIKNQGISVIGELELGYKLKIRPVISITGTNGKTTTVKLLEHIFLSANKKALAVGNVGTPITSEYKKPKKNLICEVSSFQLETIKKFKTKTTAILNITQNHLDRHLTFDNYIKSKLAIVKNIRKNDNLVLNYDDEILKNIKTNSKIYYFSINEKVKGAYLENNKIYLNIKSPIFICEKQELSLKGNHNIQNVLVSIICAYLEGISINNIKSSIKTFKGLPHRLELVDTIKGVKYINDSKSTSIESCLVAVGSYTEPIILLMGGYDKNLIYTDVFNNLPKNIKHLVFYGDIKNKLKQDLIKSNNKTAFTIAKNLFNAVNEGRKLSKDGDIILLSPATSSFDEFKSYEERGEFFKNMVKELKNEENKF